MDTLASTQEKFEFENHSEPELENIVPKTKGPNDAYHGLSQGFTLVFDSKTMLNKPKSSATTPTTPTTPTRGHQRTFSVVSNTSWTDKPDSSYPLPSSVSQSHDEGSFSDKLERTIKENIKNTIPVAENIKQSNGVHNNNVKKKEIGQIEEIIAKRNVKSSSNGNVRNGNTKSTQRIILRDPLPQESPLWKIVAKFIYFHLTAAIGFFLVLSSQVMWQTIVFSLGLHVLSAFGLSLSFIKEFIPQMFNLHILYGTLTSFVIPTAIPWILWEENAVTSFLVVSQIGYCLHLYGNWFSNRKEKTNKY